VKVLAILTLAVVAGLLFWLVDGDDVADWFRRG
jgi:hypothetical protein